MVLTESFRTAALDYQYLINRGYPTKASLKLTADRHLLSGSERSMLFRGIAPDHKIMLRKQKHADRETIQYMPLVIDGYNVLLTLCSYLKGDGIFIACDGYIRDSTEIHGRIMQQKYMNRALRLMTESIIQLNPSCTTVYLDTPKSKSGQLASHIRQLFITHHIQGLVKTIYSPDKALTQQTTGNICTSDSVIIDHCACHVFDLVHEILYHQFNPNIPDLQSLITSPNT